MLWRRYYVLCVYTGVSGACNRTFSRTLDTIYNNNNGLPFSGKCNQLNASLLNTMLFTSHCRRTFSLYNQRQSRSPERSALTPLGRSCTCEVAAACACDAIHTRPLARADGSLCQKTFGHFARIMLIQLSRAIFPPTCVCIVGRPAMKERHRVVRNTTNCIQDGACETALHVVQRGFDLTVIDDFCC